VGSDSREGVRVELRGEVCVVHCGDTPGSCLSEELVAELRECLRQGATEVVLDVDPAHSLTSGDVAALRVAADDFAGQGGALVVAVEEDDARAALAEAGLMRAVPPSPRFDGHVRDRTPLQLPARPRWEHEFTFPATAEQLRAARRRVTAFAEVAGLRGSDLFELSVAVAEALANAVLHGSPHGVDDEVRVRFFCYEEQVAVEVIDSGHGIDAAPICAPGVSDLTGRGIHFMRAFTDAVQFICGPVGTHVLLVKRRA